jgi:hypothetical protein
MLLPSKLTFLCIQRERKFMDLDTLFNDDEYLDNNMKASGIRLKTKQDPPKRGYFQDRWKGKETNTYLATQDTLSMEEVTEMLRSMVNYLCKVKKGKLTHAFIGLALRVKNQPLRNRSHFRRPPILLQR